MAQSIIGSPGSGSSSSSSAIPVLNSGNAVIVAEKLTYTTSVKTWFTTTDPIKMIVFHQMNESQSYSRLEVVYPGSSASILYTQGVNGVSLDLICETNAVKYQTYGLNNWSREPTIIFVVF